MTSNQDPIATSNLYPMAMVPTPLTEALNMHPLAQLVLEYVGDLGLWIQYPCHHDQTNVKIYQQHFANSVNQKLDELIKMVELVKSKINEKQLVSCDFVQWACPISPLCATGHGLDSIDISNVQYYDFNELAKIEDLNKKWHEVQRLQAIVYLILSQYVEQIEKLSGIKNFQMKPLQ